MRKDIDIIIAQAPERQFENGSKVRGLFQQELLAIGVTKSELKKLVRRGTVKMGKVSLFEGARNFYHIDELKPKVDKEIKETPPSS